MCVCVLVCVCVFKCVCVCVCVCVSVCVLTNRYRKLILNSLYSDLAKIIFHIFIIISLKAGSHRPSPVHHSHTFQNSTNTDSIDKNQRQPTDG